jgi:hypothetical protein
VNPIAIEEAAQVFCECSRGRVPAMRIAAQAVQANVFEFLRYGLDLPTSFPRRSVRIEDRRADFGELV